MDAIVETPVKVNRQAAYTAAFKGNDERYTPLIYIDAAREVMGGIDLDPASNDEAQKNIRATTYYTAQNDGLEHEWSGRLWFNPPYTTALITKFVDKLVASYQSGQVTEAIFLAPIRLDTKWWAHAIAPRPVMAFTHGRIRFYTREGDPKVDAPPIGSCFLYYGPNRQRFSDVFSVVGKGCWIATTGL